MFTAFIDETGASPNAPITGVVAVLFSDHSLQRFNNDWCQLALQLGGENFHTKLIVRGEKFYTNSIASGTTEERRKFLFDVAALVARTAHASFVANLHPDDFEHLGRTAPRARHALGSVVNSCLMSVVEHIAGHLQDHPGSTIKYVIEDSTSHGPNARRFFESLGNRPDIKQRLRIAGYEFMPKGGAPGLVAPDLVGWLWQRLYSEADAEENARPAVRPLQSRCTYDLAVDALFDPDKSPPVLPIHLAPGGIAALGLRLRLSRLG